MKLSDLLVDDCVVAPAETTDLRGALAAILEKASGPLAIGEAHAASLARGLARGTQGEIVRLTDDIVVAVASVEPLEGPCLGVAIAPTPLTIPAEAGIEQGEARVVFLALSPGRFSGVRRHLVGALARALRDPGQVEQLLGARSPAEVRGLRNLMDVEFRARLLVEDALVKVRYRVYPDTPLREVVDLMVRRWTRAVPVVGERYEVLGILTSGDALAHLLRRGHPEESDGASATVEQPTAKEIMTRSVLCVSEGQALVEAANMMVNRDVEQLPVVREGELVGFVTRDSILRALYGQREADTDQPKRESESNE
jgi:CBS domain-containing protein